MQVGHFGVGGGVDTRAWLGLLLIAVFVGSGYLRVKAERRSGVTQSFGHPVLDGLLLLISGLLLASGLFVAIMLLKPEPHRNTGRYFSWMLVLSLGAVLTWLCNWILRPK